jgi:hypothetical protein
MIHEDLKVLMGIDAYNKRFGALQDLMTKAVTYKDEKQGLRKTEQEALKSRLRSLLQIVLKIQPHKWVFAEFLFLSKSCLKKRMLVLS